MSAGVTNIERVKHVLEMSNLREANKILKAGMLVFNYYYYFIMLSKQVTQ